MIPVSQLIAIFLLTGADRPEAPCRYSICIMLYVRFGVKLLRLAGTEPPEEIDKIYKMDKMKKEKQSC